MYTYQVTVKYTDHVVDCGDIKRIMDSGDTAQRMSALAALDLVLRQGTVLKPEYV